MMGVLIVSCDACDRMFKWSENAAVVIVTMASGVLKPEAWCEHCLEEALHHDALG